MKDNTSGPQATTQVMALNRSLVVIQGTFKAMKNTSDPFVKKLCTERLKQIDAFIKESESVSTSTRMALFRAVALGYNTLSSLTCATDAPTMTEAIAMSDIALLEAILLEYKPRKDRPQRDLLVMVSQLDFDKVVD